ncbi:MAG: metallophosphoesterase [Simkaniaceae bacterium]|nr:metallophosphoesterase [Simkaniaceae bacterium]
MKIWAIADLHLAISTPDKKMDVFGGNWKGYQEKIKKHWALSVKPEDLVLVAGDISWAHHINEMKEDLEFLDSLPGTKVMCKGNHDYWWTSNGKMQTALPDSIHFIHNNTFDFGPISIGGSRLWDTPEYRFDKIVTIVPSEDAPPSKQRTTPEEDARIFERELERLERSLKLLNQEADHRIAMTHYPPIGLDLKPSCASHLLEKYNVDICVFGHLHNVPSDLSLFGENKGVRYDFVAGDYLDFHPLRIL